MPGDVFYSDNAIKVIVETPVKETMFFCIRDVSDGRPTGINIKGREPLAYKVENQKVFRKAINELFELINAEKFKSDPISWNLYRKINNFELDYNGYGNDIFNTNGDYIYIDDYTTDIDSIDDVQKLEILLKKLKGEFKMVKAESIKQFNLDMKRFNELKNLQRRNPNKKDNGVIYAGDIFECDEQMSLYFRNEKNLIYPTDAKGKNNPAGAVFIKVLEVIPEKVENPTCEKNSQVAEQEEPTVKENLFIQKEENTQIIEDGADTNVVTIEKPKKKTTRKKKNEK